MAAVWFARRIVRPVALLQDDRFDASVLAATVRTDLRRCTLYGLTPEATTALRMLGAGLKLTRGHPHAYLT
jgi:hypothetical protein